MKTVDSRNVSWEQGTIELTIPAKGTIWISFQSDSAKHIAITTLFNDLLLPISMDLWKVGQRRNELLASDKSGLGRRMLAIFDSGNAASYLIALSTTSSNDVICTFSIERTDFHDGETCDKDCARLLQLPVPSDWRNDGYRMTEHTLFRYQFGRRDVIMFFRHVARSMRSANYGVIIPLDLSQWDGKTPGTDVGKPRHHSHKRGIDVDLSLYDNSATARLRVYCDVRPQRSRGSARTQHEFIYTLFKQPIPLASQLVCRSGTAHDFNAYSMAKMLGLFFSTQAVRLSFLDRELLTLVKNASALTLRDGLITPEIQRLFSDGVHLQHFPNHIDHIHIRFRETRGRN